MLLYHFTAEEHLDQIMSAGLSKGDVPISERDGVNAVWLTSDKKTDGHGLSESREMTSDERSALSDLTGRVVPPGTRFADKRAIRITVKILQSDRKLKYWPKYAAKKLEPAWRAILNKTGGGKEKTWYLYFGVIPPDQFESVDDLRPPP